ncbi:hypothetical protein, partial [Oenococcus oeni]
FIEKILIPLIESITPMVAILCTYRIARLFTHKDAQEKINSDKMMQLHKESNWRKEVSKLAAKEIVNKADLINLRSRVRPITNPEKEDLDETIIYFVKRNIHKKNSEIKKDNEVAERFRLLAMLLLKSDWDFQINSVNEKKEFLDSW